ncbi:hypothetical protein AVE30378_01016 [Achromobacter veterisilvae]|uniref:Uncharacterized protein n=1 Tax=Achromobacter veterisilvae TaxID=2069367 RepID=A0A446C906_9BURK|nr:hypothetical protein [Achromobacter veterisilvae]SSW64314.1 hypothetical protein AVE30378_01016 [Achromobacter veterisilvae]
MSGGGGGGDGGAQKMEDQRQARVQAAVNAINSIFNGSPTLKGVGQANTFNQGQTYYNADGSVWAAPTKAMNATTGDRLDGYLNGNLNIWDGSSGGYNVLDQDAINQALRSGQLYTGVQRVAGMDRNAMYDQQRQAVTDLNRRDVDRQFLDAERANRFGLARSGLIGGSADIDSNAELQRRTNEGLIKAAGIGDQAAADLQTSDERSRQNLISMAQSGIDTGQAAQMALSQLDANSANAASARSGATVGNLFGDLAQAYLYGQQQQGARAGAAPYQQWQPGVSSNPRSSYAGSTS